MTTEPGRRSVTDRIPDALDGERLDRVVAMIGDVTRSVAAELVDEGRVIVDTVVLTRRSHRVETGNEITVDLPPVAVVEEMAGDRDVEFDVVYEDADIVVVDKPAGLVVHPGSGNAVGTLVHGLLHRYPELRGLGEEHRPGIVHRLDKDTSGLMVVVRNEAARLELGDALAARTVTRRYRTMVRGIIEEAQGMVDAPIGRSTKEPTKMAVAVGGREARTRYDVVERFTDPVEATELVCHLETGRTHQIRVHLQGIGHAVLGDPRYGGSRQIEGLSRQFLHAEHLAFTHPRTGDRVSFDSTLPADLVAVRAIFR